MNRHDTIAVVDFGGQYAHLIATKVRRLRVLAEIRQPEDPIEMFRPYKGIILSGSPSFSSFGEDSGYTKAIYDLDIPILGFCFGHQEIAKHYGGEVVHGGREWGRAEPARRPRAPALRGPRAGRAGVDEPLRLGGERRRGIRGARLLAAGRERGRGPPLRGHRLGQATAATASSSTPRWTTPSTATR